MYTYIDRFKLWLHSWWKDRQDARGIPSQWRVIQSQKPSVELGSWQLWAVLILVYMLYIYISYHISRLNQPLHDLADDAQLLVVFDVKRCIHASQGLPHLVLLIGIWTNASWHVVFGLPSYVHVSFRRHYWHVKLRNPLKLQCMRPFPSGEKTHSQRGVCRYVITNMRMLQTHPFGTYADFLMGTWRNKKPPGGSISMYCRKSSRNKKSGRWYEMLDLSRKLGNSLQFEDFYGFFASVANFWDNQVIPCWINKSRLVY